MPEPSDYGTTRARRADVSYGQIERAATDILSRGTRPTVEAVRNALGGGSARTILDGLNRYWKDLGARVAGHPDVTLRLPAAVADLADQLWQSALSMAKDARHGNDTAARLDALRLETELRAHAVSQKELELDHQLRSRERTVRELEDHLRATMALINKRDATIEALESRLGAALLETDQYRQRLAKVIERAVTKHQSVTPAKQKPNARRKRPKAKPSRPLAKPSSVNKPRKTRKPR